MLKYFNSFVANFLKNMSTKSKYLAKIESYLVNNKVY